MYKMLFCTGVKPENRRYLSGPNKGQLIKFEHDVWKGGVLHIAYYLESQPPAGWVVKHLCDTVQPGELSMPIIGGGMSSKFAIFVNYGGK